MARTSNFTSGGRDYIFTDVRSTVGAAVYDRMPYAARVLAENVSRHLGAPGFSADDLQHLTVRDGAHGQRSIALKISRVILPDSSGIPALMDLAALRSAVARTGLSPEAVDTAVPVDLVIDHSLQVDVSGSQDADAQNLTLELRRNAERYRFLKWAQGAFANLKVYPPGSGIIHQVNIEQISTVVRTEETPAGAQAYPDTVVGGDSHTPMVSALGIIGWGVGGIEAESVMLGEPYMLPMPGFVGMRLTGQLREGITVTDLALTVTKLLREAGVVGSIVEFFGSSMARMAVPDRATLSNMAPEYGATTGFWAVDGRTLDYLRMTGRSEEQTQLVEDYCRATGLFRDADATEPDYDRVYELELSSVERTVSGPARPHNTRQPSGVPDSLRARMKELDMPLPEFLSGLIAIASITSCTNTANPHAMMRAGLVARAAAERGLAPPGWVKTSLAPGSLAVTRYLSAAGLLTPLEMLGFHVVGYACTTCGGKSGPLKDETLKLAEAEGQPLVAVLSGNRNFDGRIHPQLTASYLCAPALVVAYALAGRLNLDIEAEPLCRDNADAPVYLRDLWPTDAAVEAMVRAHVTPEVFKSSDEVPSLSAWREIKAPRESLFPWDRESSYIVEPPFFDGHADNPTTTEDFRGAHVLGIFGDGVATDHVSPGGEILADSEAGSYLQSLGVKQPDFNTYVGRRGNHEVMARATYANPKIRNLLVSGSEGGWTKLWPEGDVVSFFAASQAYRRRGVPLIVLAGSDFGVGSSRDWAAKGPALLGVRAIIARSFERIHRSNLIGMGVAPLVFAAGDSIEHLGLDGSEIFDIAGFDDALAEGTGLHVTARHAGGDVRDFAVHVDIRSTAEAALLGRGGIFQVGLAQALARLDSAPVVPY